MPATRNRLYRHHPRPWHNPDTGSMECLTCGEAIIGVGETLRHEGEAFRPVVPAQSDRETFQEAMNIGLRALEEILTDRVDDYARVAAIVGSLYRCGAIRPRRSWRRPR